MRHFNAPSLKTLVLLSIIVPLSLLVAFRLIGILPGPSIVSETITLDTISREYERPWRRIDFSDRANSSFSSEINVVEDFLMDDYESGRQELYFNMSSWASSGYIRGLRISFAADNESARINILNNAPFVKIQGFSIADIKNGVRDSFIVLEGTGHPESASLGMPVEWILSSPGNQTHRLGVVSELVYFNGSVFKKVVQPFQFGLIGDNNNSFETAEEIHEEFYPRFFLGPNDGDLTDYYRINVTQGEKLHVTIDGRAWSWPKAPNTSPLFTVHVYDPARNPVVETENPDVSQYVDFVADPSGFWFIEIRLDDSWGFYSLLVNQ